MKQVSRSTAEQVQQIFNISIIIMSAKFFKQMSGRMLAGFHNAPFFFVGKFYFV